VEVLGVGVGVGGLGVWGVGGYRGEVFFSGGGGGVKGEEVGGAGSGCDVLRCCEIADRGCKVGARRGVSRSEVQHSPTQLHATPTPPTPTHPQFF